LTTLGLVRVALGLVTAPLAASAADVILLAPMEIRASPQPLVPAAYRKTPLPPYPAAARAQRLEGLVVLSVLVGANGRVVDVSVASSSGHAVLDQAAAGAVKTWTFAPAHRGARAVESVVEVPLKFALGRE